MGYSILELVLRRLREEGFAADVAFPGQKYPQIRDAEKQLRDAGLPIFHHIRRSDKVDKMTFQQDPLLISSPNSAAGVDYKKFVAEYVGGMNNGI